ncbi:hypothetical protein E5K00_08215 [Hymenobacter aquaticus]|uniref:Uncharacterized protein n=1 Tax=Hymenobacter aquaticus TaxID=1867101 RepID=A0A4Z0Q513_9BACT|nr:hypothetical protein [Hymenobacter aquaticus]TGE25168.1 hypothetical protein E5K00_08215 [Hymenobacter aquaticus]
MDNVSIIACLRNLGSLPDDSTPAIDDFPLEKFDELVQQLSEPLEPDHSLALINLGPPRGTSACGIEWSLIHAAEAVSAEVLRDVLFDADDTEVKRIIAMRLANHFENDAK